MLHWCEREPYSINPQQNLEYLQNTGHLTATSHLALLLTRPWAAQHEEGSDASQPQPHNSGIKQFSAPHLTSNPCADKQYIVPIKRFSIIHLVLLLRFAPWGRQPLAVGRWLSYSGVVRILFPEQLRAVAERLCRCHVIHSVSILKVSMCCAGVCPGIHRRFPDSLSFFSGWKEISLLCRDPPKRKIFPLWNDRFGGGHDGAYGALLPPSGLEGCCSYNHLCKNVSVFECIPRLQCNFKKIVILHRIRVVVMFNVVDIVVMSGNSSRAQVVSLKAFFSRCIIITFYN